MILRFLTIHILCNFIFLISTFCQTTDENENNPGDSIPAVTQYEKYNKILGGDSVRYCNGYICKGWVKDFYKSQNLKHRGFYVDGRLESVYKNYYDNGQLEREFAIKNYKKSTMNIYYPNGNKLSEIEYLFTEPIFWTDYYPNKQIEYTEKFDDSGEYILYRKFFYKTGQPQSSLVLIDKRNDIFEKIEYYPDGKVKEKGQMLFNKSLGDYQKTGKWIYYKENGEPLPEEQYYKNKIIDKADE